MQARTFVRIRPMDAFWLNPAAPRDPAASVRLWDAVLAFVQPATVTRHVGPLKRAHIIKAGSTAPDIEPAVWGLVPAWAAAAERRSVAQRHTLLDGQLVPNSSLLRELWEAQQPSQRCLVPASGWTAMSAYTRLAFAPHDPGPLTFAGLHCLVRPEGRKPVYTFGVFFRVMSLFPYDGSRVPVIIRAEDRMRWLNGTASEARRLLVPSGMKVIARPVRGGHRVPDVVLGPHVAGLDD